MYHIIVYTGFCSFYYSADGKTPSQWDDGEKCEQAAEGLELMSKFNGKNWTYTVVLL